MRTLQGLISYIDKTSKVRSPVSEVKDGRIALSMTASGKEEIKAWILSFGPKAKVPSPKFIEEEMEEDILKTLALYGSKKE